MHTGKKFHQIFIFLKTKEPNAKELLTSQCSQVWHHDIMNGAAMQQSEPIWDASDTAKKLYFWPKEKDFIFN